MNNIASKDGPASRAEASRPEDLPLRLLLANKGLSARLSNLLARGKLGKLTLAEFVNKRDDVQTWMFRQPNCGRKTVNELMVLIDSMPRPTIPSASVQCPPLDDVALLDLLAADVLSARLVQVLRQTSLGKMKLSEYVRRREEVEAKMLRRPNCGRHSVMELRRVVSLHIRAQMIRHGLEMRDHGGILSALIDALPSNAELSFEPPANCGLQELIKWHLGRLTPRRQDVISRRFGLNGQAPQTLAEIGEEYELTRERIRQIEAKGLRAVKMACRRFSIASLVEDCSPELLTSIFRQRRHATAGEADQGMAALEGWQVLALELSYGSSRSWFEAKATRFGRGWLAPGVTPASVTQIADELRRRAAGLPFPRAADDLVDGLDQSLVQAAVDLVLDWRIEAGYVFPRRPGPRMRRTALLHALLSTQYQALEMALLLRRYHEMAPGDPCTDRDLVIVMETASHLFLEIQEGSWAAIGQAAPLSVPTETLPGAEDLVPERETEEEGTIAVALERELALTGPTRLGTLIARAIDILPEGRSRNSVGPTLLLNPTRFVRILPGIYALPDQVLDGPGLVRAGSVDYLLNATQARIYAIARMAGERWATFPLWIPAAEMRLCRWARSSEERSLYRSLLKIASIDDWPTDGEDKEVWHSLKQRDARFELWFEPKYDRARPPLDRVLAAALRLREQGVIGWVMVNRILGYRPDSFTAAGLLAGLVAVGAALRPVGEFAWQLPHMAGPQLGDWIERLSGCLHQTGKLDWATSLGIEFAAAFDANGAVDDPLEEESPDDFDEYESIMAEHRRSVLARRLEARIEMLDQ